MTPEHPRDRYLTVYGRKPVLEVLADDTLSVARVLIARGARGAIISQIRAAARERGVEVMEKSAEQVSRISRRPNQDQGVAADVEAPAMGPIEDWLERHEGSASLLALDGVTTPANVGMILRTATVIGLDGVIVPRRGTATIGPHVIKASAGVAFRASILRCATIVDGLSAAKMAGFCVYGLSDRAGTSIADVAFRERSILLLGNESEGVGAAAAPLVDEWLAIPMASRGDSLNVASAAAICAFVLRPRRSPS